MSTQLVRNSMSLPPPPSLHLELLDAERRVGWVRDGTIGFRGFANETEAAHAAWVAYRTLSRWLARRHGGRPAPVDVEPLALARDGDREAIVASSRPIAYLVRPAIDSLSGTNSFGFEIHVPIKPEELTMRAISYRIYRTLRKSGIRWAIWDGRRAAAAHRAAEPAQGLRVPTAHSAKRAPSALGFVSTLVLTFIGIVMGAAVIATAPATVTLPIAVALAAGLVASGLVTTVDRRAARARGRATHRRRVARSDEQMRNSGWLALGGVSLAVLTAAVVVPTDLGVALAAIGFTGLAAFRVTSAWAGFGRRSHPRGPA